ncbi:helix-turn-helix domain-containing protein [Hyphomicrobium sp.]|uniref:AraC-like ligand-binding domain-containing protein n=1 Tax=Hyphomicrobium sp. TaxID=82 RepID=UPI000FBB6CA9|nr:helix-turn-helix domain-containing protein [Hyphomicrobium sp.]RUO99156.1 MAG: helix-turn-helix domain-containing protein [Hyphomicrobium sp.]
MLRALSAPVRVAGDDLIDWSISTTDVHPRDRFDYWFETSRQVLGPYETRPDHPARFEGDLRYLRVPGMAFSIFRCNGMRSWRTKHQAALLSDLVHIVIQLSGTLKIDQDGRQAELRPEDICLLDLGRHASFVQSRDFHCLVIEVPRRDCEARLGPLRRWTARPVNGHSGSGVLASTFAKLLPDQISVLSSTSQAQVKHQLLELMAMALKDAEGNTCIHSSTRLASLLRLKTVVDANLSNRAATCEDLASEAGISVRYANQLLDAEQTSLQRLLFSRRIEKCQAALADPAQAHRQISDIAYTWGFGDVSHFGRLFKSVVGMTPREFKKQTLGRVDRM